MEMVPTDSLKAAREVIQLFSWKDIGKAENLFCFPCGESPCPSEELQMQKSYVHTMHRSRISEVSKIKPELFRAIEKKTNPLPATAVIFLNTGLGLKHMSFLWDTVHPMTWWLRQGHVISGQE